MRKTATAEEVMALFVIEDIDEATKALVETVSEKLDPETSSELLNAALGALSAEETAELNMYEKMLLLARQCFLMGFTDAFTKYAEASQMSYTKLFQNE